MAGPVFCSLDRYFEPVWIDIFQGVVARIGVQIHLLRAGEELHGVWLFQRIRLGVFGILGDESSQAARQISGFEVVQPALPVAFLLGELVGFFGSAKAIIV